MGREAHADAWLSFGVDCFAVELDAAMRTSVCFFRSLHALRMLRVRRLQGTLSGGSASRLPVELWDLLISSCRSTARESFRDEMDDITVRTMCDACKSKTQPDIRLRWGDHPSVHKNPDCGAYYELAEPVVEQIYNDWRPVDFFLHEYHLAVKWHRWPLSEYNIDYPEEAEAEAEDQGWFFNVAQTEFVHLRYRSSLGKVLRGAGTATGYGPNSETTNLPSTEQVVAILSKPCWNATFRRFFGDWDFSDVQSRAPAFPDGTGKPALRLECQVNMYE
ncbi:hypothetical protein OF846_000216 [Rhodotorula toruloides]|nr:hypothetical protein OF846_000216 [Rhodotorula toruloides]